VSTIDLPFHERYSLEPAEPIAPVRSARLLNLSMPMLWVGDVAVVTSAFLAAYLIRFVRADDEAAGLTLLACLKIAVVVAFSATVLFAQHGFYVREGLSVARARTGVIASTLSIAVVVAVTLSYFIGDPRYSRLWLATGWLLSIGGLTLWRWFAESIFRKIRGSLLPAPRVIIVGANSVGEDLARDLAGRYDVVGYIDNGSDLDPSNGAIPLLGPIAELERFVHAYAVDELFVALPAGRHEQIVNVISRGFRRRVEVRFLPEIGQLALPENAEIRHIGTRSVIGFAPAARITALKRVVDLSLGLVLFTLLLPVFAAIAVAIKFDSEGSVVYRQIRVGKDGRRFEMLKFRSMLCEAEAMVEALRDRNEAVGPLFKIRDDPRITRVGAFLRRYSLDELPQLVNVLRGEMSLVGPRPPLPDEVRAYEEWQLGRLRAVPGMTGLWQVSGRSEVPFHDMVRLDLHYIRNWSPGLDLQILLRTLPAVFTNRGAY
jgi:exopolysaccharide biosynthesis polyprenyl glycosylphosphotransferase